MEKTDNVSYKNVAGAAKEMAKTDSKGDNKRGCSDPSSAIQKWNTLC